MVIDSPVAFGTLLIRVLVRNNGTDLTQAQQIIKACKLTKAKAPSYPDISGVAPLNVSIFANLSTKDLPLSILELTARTLKACPPFNVTNRRAVLKELAAAGITKGSYKPPSGINLTAIADYALATASADFKKYITPLNNGKMQIWRIM
jgi:hypothetical protein